MPRRAVLLDRDGVLVLDRGPPAPADDLVIVEDAANVIAALRARGFVVIVATNQTAVARGLLDEAALRRVHDELCRELRRRNSAAAIDAIYVCPHHPNANLAQYRMVCQCRKPSPGMLLRAASDYDLALTDSWMVGDRVSDMIAGTLAGCRTVLVESGAHDAPLIETTSMFESVVPRVDRRISSLAELLDVIT